MTTHNPSEVERAWLELRERLNREHQEGIISYRELKAGINAAAIIRDAALASIPLDPDVELIEVMDWLLGLAAGHVEMGDPNYERAGALFERLNNKKGETDG